MDSQSADERRVSDLAVEISFAAKNIGWFISTVLAATIGTAIAETPFIRPHQSLSEIVNREYCLSALCALGLGCFFFRIWGHPSAKWTWTVGVIRVGQRTIILMLQQYLPFSAHNGAALAAHMAGLSCNVDRSSCSDWLAYTIASVRTLFFSVGALLCERLVPHGPLRPANSPDHSPSVELREESKEESGGE